MTPKHDDSEKELVEEVAKAIFECAYYGRPDHENKPSWVARGNSIMQQDARDFARKALTAARPIIEAQAVEKMFRDFLVWNKGKIPHDIGTVNYLNRFIRVYAKERHNINLTDPKDGEK